MEMPLTRPTEMAKTYDHNRVEERLYSQWESGGFFQPQLHQPGPPFTIVMPPPNVTGELHHGHAMFVTFEDLMTRWRRMQGRPTLWLPGTDHAGIATQNVVEAALAREGLSRFDLGREKFVDRVWQWKEQYGGIITQQLRRLGASCDWTRERFTMDPGLSRAVREAFVRLHQRGLIYQGEYLINWCPRCGTALSDLEVEHKEVAGKLYLVRYPLAERQGEAAEVLHSAEAGFITVATTRPETILGDTAVAVNPHDERYRDLVGREAMLPAVGRIIPIIADPAVDPAFGTGAVKVTPAHDPTDYEIGQRHRLPSVNIMNKDGTLNANAGRYAGLDRYVARDALAADLDRQGLLLRTVDYAHSIGHCDRCGTVVEPLLSEQWFVSIKPLAEPAIQAVADGRIRFVPERFARVYFNWMENIRDWCISRQLWWGHRIPVWYCQDCGEQIVSVDDPTDCPSCSSSRLEQDPDVLDTWFSSGLWPFSTLGWPDDTEDLRHFYPTSVMETGYDIIFFWVARMIMAGLAFTDQVPFHTVYLHGLLRDERGEKMSKSKGNVANPLDVIARYGADALRFSIATGSTPGNDMKLSEEKLQGSRNFANKLWNAARFVIASGAASAEAATFTPEEPDLELADRWILSRANQVTADVTRLLEEYQFGEAGRILYDFIWGEFCDWYIEIAKVRLYDDDVDERAKQTAAYGLRTVLDRILRLLHPYAPFVTEEIWQQLPFEHGFLIAADWPQPGPTDAESEGRMALVMDVIRAIRNARAEFGVEPSHWIEAQLAAGSFRVLLDEQSALIHALGKVRPLQVHGDLAQPPEQALHAVAGPVEIFLPLSGLVDLEEERARLQRDIASLEGQITKLQARLANQEFLARAPAAVVQRERDRLAGFEETRGKLQDRLRALGG